MPRNDAMRRKAIQSAKGERLVEVTAVEAAEIAERSADGDLSVPTLISKTYANAEQMAAYRESQRISGAEHD